MSEDLIKRSDAIDIIEITPFEDYGDYIKAREIIENLPTIDVVPKDFHDKTCEAMAKRHTEEIQKFMWIPCSERLPSEKGMYLVTSREKATAEEFGFDLDDVEVKKMRFDEDGWRIPKHIPEWINGVVHTTVLAWMPLPKPYGEREGE